LLIGLRRIVSQILINTHQEFLNASSPSRNMNILNNGQGEELQEKKSAEELAKQLQKSMLRMKGDYMTPDGRGVDYDSLVSSDTFRDYVAMSRLLGQCDLSLLSEDTRKAFFVSILY